MVAALDPPEAPLKPRPDVATTAANTDAAVPDEAGRGMREGGGLGGATGSAVDAPLDGAAVKGEARAADDGSAGQSTAVSSTADTPGGGMKAAAAATGGEGTAGAQGGEVCAAAAPSPDGLLRGSGTGEAPLGAAQPSAQQLLLALAVAAAQLPPPLLHRGCWGGAGGSTSSLECSSEEPDSTSSQLRSQMAWRGRESMGEKYWRGSSCTRRTGCSACPLGRNPTAFERALKASHLVNTRAAHLARPNRLEKGVLEQLPGLGAQLGVVADTELDELTRLVVRHLAQAAGEHAL